MPAASAFVERWGHQNLFLQASFENNHESISSVGYRKKKNNHESPSETVAAIDAVTTKYAKDTKKILEGRH